MRMAERVAATYMGLSIEEKNGEILVSGPYSVIQPYLAKLKSMKFRYNGTDRSWRHPAAPKFDVESVKVKLFGTEKDQVAKAEVEQEKAQERTETRQRMVADTTEAMQKFPRDFESFSVVTSPGEIRIQGETYPLRADFAAAGFLWKTDAYEVHAEWTTPEKLTALQHHMQKAEHGFQHRKGEIIKAVKEWKEPGATLYVKGRYLTINLAPGYRVFFKSIFDHLHGTNQIPLIGITPKQLQSLADTLQGQRQDLLKKDEEIRTRQEEDTRRGIQRFHRLTRSYQIGEVFEVRGEAYTVERGVEKKWFDSEDAMSFGIMNMDRSGFVYYASARPSTQEEMDKAGITQRRQEREKTRTLAQVVKTLREMIQKEGTIPPGNHRLSPAFYKMDERLVAYGGGSWFVEEGSDVWYVENHGADGDDWGHNNVSTGGAGAVGWRTRVTPEIQSLIDQIKRG